jgi:uncharacterized protein YndB with AHSA1/START domain
MNDSTPAAAVAPQHSDSAGSAERSYFRVVIRAPIHKVWAELTRTDALLPFFFNSVCKTTTLGVKSPVRMQSKDRRYTSDVWEVLEYDTPYRYSHTFKFTNIDDTP